MAPPRKRDSSFLFPAALAATGGVTAIVFSIGFPLWDRMHGHPVSPVFSLFAAWGLAALAGAYACLRTYLDTEAPTRPPRGGVRLTILSGGASAPSAIGGSDRPRERAA